MLSRAAIGDSAMAARAIQGTYFHVIPLCQGPVVGFSSGPATPSRVAPPIGRRLLHLHRHEFPLSFSIHPAHARNLQHQHMIQQVGLHPEPAFLE